MKNKERRTPDGHLIIWFEDIAVISGVRWLLNG